MKQDLAGIAPEKRLGSALGNKEILERRYTQMNTHNKCMILLIKELSSKAIAQLNLKEVI